jgi:TldD protein
LLAIELTPTHGAPRVKTLGYAVEGEADRRGTRTLTAVAPWLRDAALSHQSVDAKESARHLQALVGCLGPTAVVSYRRVMARRWVFDSLGQRVERPIDLFAVTGRFDAGQGRTIPIGWSGRGDGFDAARVAAADRLAWIATAVARAEPTANETVPAVLSPTAAAVIVHEAIGHFVEASAQPAVDLRHRLGSRLACEGFDAFDDPLYDSAAHYLVDDDGTNVLGPTAVVRDGLVAGQLHGLRSAAVSGTLPTANGRAAQIAQPPIPRISNLVIRPGRAAFDELVAQVGRGVIIHQVAHGFSRGVELSARVVLGQRVESGQPTDRFFTGGVLSERIDLLTRCVDLGARAETNPNALCGKAGQILYDVGTVTPAILLSALRLVA